jgi:two-component system NtrC family sensor kinase
MQKEKLSAVGQVIGMVMHDLRTPIKNIKLMTSMIREEGDDNDLIDLIDRSAEQASEIFDDFLDFIKDTPVQKKPVRLSKIVNDAINMAEGRDGAAQVTITTHIPQDLMIPADESKLRRSIGNLINNGVDALYGNKVANAVINIDAMVDASQVSITISDNGPGIPGEIMKTLFEPFVTRHKSNGTGLGLAIVKQFINAHGGTISVTNNNGAAFTIILPL